ncbi:Helicase required for RNAi-mediated heterochromatin assembly 1 [Penicillium digitatum PHI26]|uniref:Helicase required for RNAi-mediated heterochromatin assembly 1 n=2 Tax=Penicillium digitatum TaxID=36651 RepID=K9G765_PEND2|nr:Helicase required for RNAi-mediated heterochromatin assembly 1 [Penicillium digitatum Pd1]EKV10678.1 Helicase required for RNAi-mediated heterochromatin assembly 1 [Penicillium digitatum PHI26]EKV13088.1 Helicase required for RNAi-mediated heterochromatin assembly 1 [Penicillium digitatum Pd1]
MDIRLRSRSNLLIWKSVNTLTRIYQSTALGNIGKPNQSFRLPKKSSGQTYQETLLLLPPTAFQNQAHNALIREDSVAPLRNAVARVRADPFVKDTPDVSIYEKVFVVGITLARAGLALQIQFSIRRAGKNIAWTYSNRLNTGAVVALTLKNNAFSSKCVITVVACRLLEAIEKDPPEVDLFGFTRRDRG